jgi:outer membrane protein assembly factor BamB
MRGSWAALRAAAVGAAALALAGCWPAPGQGPDRQSNNTLETRITFHSAPSLAEDWTVDTGDASAGAPIVSPDGVHVRGGTILHALAPPDGAERWTFDPEVPAPVGQMSDPIWEGGRVFVGYGFPNLGGNWEGSALDGGTGEPVLDLGGGVYDALRGSSLAELWAGFGSGTPVALGLAVTGDVDDPATRWSGYLAVLNQGEGSPQVAPTVGTGGVFHAGRGPMATTPSTNPSSGNGVRMYTIDRPAQCYAGGETPFFPCPTWATPTDDVVSTSPVIGPGGDTVYVGTRAGTVYALDAANGAVRWTVSVGAAVTATPAFAESKLFVPTADGDLVVVDSTGGVLWSGPTGSALTVQPAVAGGAVFTGSSDGSLHAFRVAGCRAATCDPLWSEETGSAITGAPAVSFGRLYVGTQDGRVISYVPRPG